MNEALQCPPPVPAGHHSRGPEQQVGSAMPGRGNEQGSRLNLTHTHTHKHTHACTHTTPHMNACIHRELPSHFTHTYTPSNATPAADNSTDNGATTVCHGASPGVWARVFCMCQGDKDI